MKKCFKCGSVKPVDEFYKHKMMADGRLNKCKECTKIDVRSNRIDKIDYYRKYDETRYKEDPSVKQRISRFTKQYRIDNPEKYNAHNMVSLAVRMGRLIKPDECTMCGKFTAKRKMHGHHEDYSKPLDVVWLCAACHSTKHEK